MSEKRFHVVFTGKLTVGMDAGTVKSNLVLDIGLSDAKADQLLSTSRVLLKRYASATEAERMAERLERAGAICVIEDHGPAETPSGSESSFVTFMSRFIPVPGRSAAARKST